MPNYKITRGPIGPFPKDRIVSEQDLVALYPGRGDIDATVHNRATLDRLLHDGTIIATNDLASTDNDQKSSGPASGQSATPESDAAPHATLSVEQGTPTDAVQGNPQQ